MRRVAQRGPTPFAVGLDRARRRRRSASTSASRSRSRSSHHYEIKAAFRVQQPAAGLAGADRRRQGRQGHRGRARAHGRRRRDGDDADRQAGLPIHRDARLKIRPRIFLEGNFFVDLKPGSPRRAELERRRHDPGQADRDARSSSTRCSTALQSDTRDGPQDAAATSTATALDGERRARASTARSRTGSPPTATRRSSPTRARRAAARPVGLRRRTPARSPRALDRDPRAAART